MRLVPAVVAAAFMIGGAAYAQQHQQRDAQPASPVQAQTQGPAGQARSLTGPISVNQLTGMNVYNQRNESIGSIDDVIVDTKQQLHVVIGANAWTNNREIMIPMEKLQTVGDRLVIQGLNDEELRRSPAYDRRKAAFTQAERHQQIEMKREQPAGAAQTGTVGGAGAR